MAELDRPTLLPDELSGGASIAVAIPRLEFSVRREAGQPSTRSSVLDGDELRIGSHPKNDLTLDDPQVSRFHCSLSRSSHGWTITDHDSKNGTFVNGIRVRDADLPRGQCQFELGTSAIVVRELGSETIAELPSVSHFGELFGETPPMRQLFALLERVAESDSTVLIEGESGTGKELVATEIARRSERANAPFVIVDCSAIAPNLMESELFGHIKGAFTGANRQRIGAFEAANGGTIFLDEIGELPLDMQPKLLRALESREIRRMGENLPRKINVRVIAATNRRLEREVNRGRFREDLYFRLSVVNVRLPPLRKRMGDLRLLVQVILASLNAEDRTHLFTNKVLDEMATYDWPGNVRELRNYVERSVVMDEAPPASRRPGSIRPPADTGQPSTSVDLDVPFRKAKESLIANFERNYLVALLEWSNGNVSKAARQARMDRMYLYRLLQRHKLRGGSRIDD